MPWSVVLELIGPGLHWNKPQDVFINAIQEAESRNRPDVAEHLREILRLRNAVTFETPLRPHE